MSWGLVTLLDNYLLNFGQIPRSATAIQLDAVMQLDAGFRIYVRVHMRTYACVYACVCVCICVRMSVCACVCVPVFHVRAHRIAPAGPPVDRVE